MSTTGKLIEVLEGDYLASVINLDRSFFPRPWSKEQWNSIDFTHHFLWAWKSGESIIGFALFFHVQGDNSAHLLKICLKKEHHGSGEVLDFWRELLFQLSQRNIGQIYLEVEENNQRAIGFYNKVGFMPLRTVKGFYSDGTNGHMMLLTL